MLPEHYFGRDWYATSSEPRALAFEKILPLSRCRLESRFSAQVLLAVPGATGLMLCWCSNKGRQHKDLEKCGPAGSGQSR